MSRLALYIILGALRPRTSTARKVQIILPQTVGNTAHYVCAQNDRNRMSFSTISTLGLVGFDMIAGKL